MPYRRRIRRRASGARDPHWSLNARLATGSGAGYEAKAEEQPLHRIEAQKTTHDELASDKPDDGNRQCNDIDGFENIAHGFQERAFAQEYAAMRIKKQSRNREIDPGVEHEERAADQETRKRAEPKPPGCIRMHNPVVSPELISRHRIPRHHGRDNVKADRDSGTSIIIRNGNSVELSVHGLEKNDGAVMLAYADGGAAGYSTTFRRGSDLRAPFNRNRRPIRFGNVRKCPSCSLNETYSPGANVCFSSLNPGSSSLVEFGS